MLRHHSQTMVAWAMMAAAVVAVVAVAMLPMACTDRQEVTRRAERRARSIRVAHHHTSKSRQRAEMVVQVQRRRLAMASIFSYSSGAALVCCGGDHTHLCVHIVVHGVCFH